MKPIILGNKITKVLTRYANNFAGPENRLILGVSALASQPFIDYYNKNVDEKTRKYSVCKTISKIIVGTTVGVIVRAMAIKHAAHLMNTAYIAKSMPEALKNPQTKKILQNTIGDIMGLGICIFSNFLIDAPLTKMGTNLLIKNFIKENKNG